MQATKSHNENAENCAQINTDENGDILGAAVFLGADDLAALGIDSADKVEYHIKNGTLRLKGVEK